MTARKLALGTVQFGLDYGVSNQFGRPSLDEVGRVLDLAYDHGITTLDTAPAYGTAESVLGELDAASRFEVYSKTPQIPSAQLTGSEVDGLRRSIEGSLRHLRTSKLAGLLVHSAGNLLGPAGEGCYRALDSAKRDGLTAAIGVSVYTPEELSTVLDRYEMDAVQLPFNVFDRRFAASGLLARCRQIGVKVFARSAFLQGLLLMRPDAIPPRVAAARPFVERFDRLCRDLGATPLAACLAFALTQPLIDKVVIGVARLSELAEILAAANANPDLGGALDPLALDDQRIIDPRCWA